MWQPSLDKILHDLEWVINSPSLIKDGFIPVQLFKVEELQNLTLEQVANYVNQNPFSKREYKRLGYYFEYLFKMGVQLVSDHQIAAENLQLQREGKTIGELDFLTQSLTGEVFHWEIAVKFYLQTGTPEKLANWVGPAVIDNFDKKWRKLITQQLTILKTEEGKHFLEEKKLEDVQSGLFLKGYLFRGLTEELSQYPDIVNPNHLRGWWIQVDKLFQFFDKKMQWVILPKHDWLSPFETKDEKLILNTSSLVVHLKNGKEKFRPQLVVGVEEHENGFNEVTRGFVAPTGWPFDLD